MVVYILIVLIAVVVIILLGRGRTSDKRRAKGLRKEFVQLSRMPKDVAEETLDRQVETLKRKFPNRSITWYLEKVLYDLERDRRA